MTDQGKLVCGNETEDPKPEEQPESFLEINGKSIPEKAYHPACSQLHKLAAKIRSLAMEIWEKEYPKFTPEQALAKAIEKFLPELE